MRKLTTESFIEKAKIVHGGKYNYSKVQYVGAHSKVIIVCPEHGEFEQSPNKHTQGQNCPKCGNESSGDSRKLTQEQFITKAKSIHGDMYNYDKVKYISVHKKMIITCPEHGDFEQSANSHINFGSGCPHCGLENKGWNRTKFVNKCESKDGIGTLYVIECYNETESFIKFGITSRSIEERYCSKDKMPYDYRILAECNGTPEMIWNIEKGLKRQMKLSHYVPQIEFCGHATECFIRTVE